MNVNELADDLEKYDWYYEHEVTGADGYTQEIKTCNTEYVWDAAAMLRQQQAEIDSIIEKNKPEIEKANAYIKALEDEIEALKTVLEQEGIGVGRDLLNGGIALFRKAQET